MAQKQMIRIAVKLNKSRIYHRLEAFVEFFDEGNHVAKLARKIRKLFVILKRRINRIIRKMRLRGISDGKRFYFYKLVRKFLPAFIRVWNINLSQL